MSEEQVAKLIEQVNGLHLDEELQELKGSNDQSIDLQSVAVFQQWLVRKSSCPVNYQWTDLGDYFWPKWIRHGSCQNISDQKIGKSETCSWPNGMKCIQGEVQMLQILRWHCRKRHNKSKSIRKRKCKWYKVPYPVTSTCKCACSS